MTPKIGDTIQVNEGTRTYRGTVKSLGEKHGELVVGYDTAVNGEVLKLWAYASSVRVVS